MPQLVGQTGRFIYNHCRVDFDWPYTPIEDLCVKQTNFLVSIAEVTTRAVLTFKDKPSLGSFLDELQA